VKIVELGHTQVGKTTYMASMYGAMQSQINGFSLLATDTSVHTELCKLENAIKRGIYPPPTSVRSNYNFFLQYQGDNVLPFFWADYRGNAIREGKEISEQAKKLHQDLREADGITIFCDCLALANDNVRANELRRITALVTNNLQNLDHPISISIVFTKTDLVENLKPSLLDPLKGLIQAIEVSNLISGALIPVACGQKMVNVQMPVLFSLQEAIKHKVKTLKEEVEKHQAEERKQSSLVSQYQYKSSGLGGAIRDWWRENVEEVPGYARLAIRAAESARQAKRSAEDKLEVYQPLVLPADALEQYLQEIPRIKHGESYRKYIKRLSVTKRGILNRLASFFS
jgi:hypothetical protein